MAIVIGHDSLVEHRTCWSCHRPVESPTESCLWCGVWLDALDASVVPALLVPLSDLARQWGIGDDGYRDDAVYSANCAALETLVAQVDTTPDDAWDWLIGPEAHAEHPSKEWIAFSCLMMAYEVAKFRLAHEGM